MKKLITLAALAIAGLARAGDYHEGVELKCQQCHTMHASRAHGFEIITATGAVNPTPATYTTQQDNLLIAAGTNETCLACHDKGGTSGYDVFGAGGSTNGVRSAGALNGTVGTHVATAAQGYDAGTGHTMGFSGSAPGSAGAPFTTTNFSCGDCHAVHGNAAYRNLGDVAKGFTAAMQPSFATTTVGVNVFDYDVVEEEAAAYRTSQVQFGSGAGANRMNTYCGKCHGDFHGDANVQGTGGNFKRHPIGNATTLYDFATNATIGGIARYTATDIVRPVQTAAARVSPGCLSCHKGHGNKRAFGLVHPTGGGVANANLEEGDLVGVVDYTGTRTFYNPRTLCTTCHIQGQ